MAKTRFLFFALLLLPPLLLKSQEKDKTRNNLYFESGIDFQDCYSTPDKSYIRGDVKPYPMYYDEPSYMTGLFYRYYFSVKAEKKLVNGMIGLSGGIRYVHTESSLGKDDYWKTGSDYFYVLYHQDETTTEFLRVNDISQQSDYLALPAELRIYPYRSRTIQMYYKIGGDFHFLINSKDKITFYSSGMNEFENEVSEIIEDPWPFFASVHLAVGMKIGVDNKPGVNIEACFPSFIILPEQQALVQPDFGGGIQINVRIPF